MSLQSELPFKTEIYSGPFECFYSTKTAGGRVDFDYYRIGQSGGSR